MDRSDPATVNSEHEGHEGRGGRSGLFGIGGLEVFEEAGERRVGRRFRSGEAGMASTKSDL